MIFGRHSPERLLDGCDLRLDFDFPQDLCSFRAFPINNSPSCILLFGNSHYDLGAVVRTLPSRSYFFTVLNPRIASTVRKIVISCEPGATA